MRRYFLTILVMFCVAVASGTAYAAKRVALVIGNGNYPQVGVLPNPPNDARLMARTLRELDFEVIEAIDADQKAMKRAISRFGEKLSNAGKDAVGLFFYAGHGVQVNGTNYLIPVNVHINNESDVDIEAVSANAVQGKMAYAGNRLNIIIMDACRNNPFKRGFRSAARGLAKMDASMGTLIAYATAPGDVAADGTGANSPYTEALTRTMRTPGLSVERVFKQVRNDVVAATNKQQVPWESSSLTGGDFFFKALPPKPKEPPKPVGPSAEMIFWQSIQNSDDPASFKAYIKRYPKGEFASLAEVNLRHLERAQQRQEAEQKRAASIEQDRLRLERERLRLEQERSASLEQERLRLEQERLRLAKVAQKAKQTPAPAPTVASPPISQVASLPPAALNLEGTWDWKIKYTRGRHCTSDFPKPMIIENNKIESSVRTSDITIWLSGEVDDLGEINMNGSKRGDHLKIEGKFIGKKGAGKVKFDGEDGICIGTWEATWVGTN